MIEIPKGDWESPGPCWIATERYDNGRPAKPLIKCQCGEIRHIGLHHVHEDGRVTASFFHDSAPHPEISYPGGGCGWHVWLKLKDYNQGEFTPNA